MHKHWNAFLKILRVIKKALTDCVEFGLVGGQELKSLLAAQKTGGERQISGTRDVFPSALQKQKIILPDSHRVLLITGKMRLDYHYFSLCNYQWQIRINQPFP